MKMYHVITIYGPNEPWFLFEGWEKDIVERKVYTSLEEAQQYFLEKSMQLEQAHQHRREKRSDCFAYWNEGDIHFCEMCDEDIQLFTGLFIEVVE